MTNKWIIFPVLLLSVLSVVLPETVIIERPRNTINIGPCTWVINRKCPDDDIEFYLYTRQNLHDRQFIHVDETWENSNLSSSYFNPYHPVKIIIHGYNSDMFLHPLVQMKDEYLQRGDYNLLYVEWSKLSSGPCYFSAVHNSRHVGACIAQLIERILEAGTANIHLIGFSLGAQVTNFVSTNLGSFYIPRITGLDPAMPLFITAPNEDKLDPSDAVFVDIMHTNALVQGKIERCGHVDFYMNGGVIQPGCFNQHENPFACSHHRAPDYYAESIRSYKGFWGWACSSYINYLLGLCPPTNYLVLAGEDCHPETEGMFMITTNSEPPFAQGKWTELNNLPTQSDIIFKRTNLLRKEIDQWGKLEGSFNNIMLPTPYSQDPNGGNYPYFGYQGTKEITSSVDNDVKKISTGHSNELKNHRHQTQKNSPKMKVRRPQNSTNQNANPQKLRKVLLEEYKRNLTKGIMDASVFQLPTISLD